LKEKEWLKEKFKINPEDITNEKSLNEDKFGTFYSANYKGEDVVIKHVDYFQFESDYGRILKDRDIIFLCDLASRGDNKFIGKFYGWCLVEKTIKIVLEPSIRSDIYSYLEPYSYYKYTFNLKQKIKILLESAMGLAFLHKNGIIHTQFKSFNISLNKILVEPNDLDFTVKLTEFELFRGDDTNHCMKSGRYKYDAPESFENDIFTNKSDIWQFGLFVFEMFSGRVCYTDKITKNFNDTSIQKKTENGFRPHYKVEIMDDCPPEIIEFYMKCWEFHQKDRPNLKEVIEFLTAFYDKLG
jgi:serine/threonine protein kinase